MTGEYANGVTVPKFFGTYDYGVALPLRHSSIWSRSAAGFSTGDLDLPIANFYFGGFGNNYVDNKSVKRYRQYDSFPGFGINEIRAQSFVREMAELNLPPYVFESVGTPGFFLNWLQPSVFVAGLWADPGNSALKKDYASLGAQVDMRINVLHWYAMTLSAGYALGFQSGRRTDSEWMLSLKIM
jgi:hypothetical protein